MSTIYDDVADGILPLLPYLATDAMVTWTVVRANATTRVPAVNGVITGAVMRGKVDVAMLDLSQQTTIFTAPWLFMGALLQDVTTEDVIVSGSHSFAVVGRPQTDMMMLIIPLQPAVNPLRGAPPRLTQQGARLGLRQGM